MWRKHPCFWHLLTNENPNDMAVWLMGVLLELMDQTHKQNTFAFVGVLLETLLMWFFVSVCCVAKF